MLQNLSTIEKLGGDKLQWSKHFIERGFQGLWKTNFPLIPINLLTLFSFL